MKLNKNHKPIDNLVPNEIYVSPSGIKFRYHGTYRHGQDCSVAMTHYENIQPTKDYPTGTHWVIEESLFLKIFSLD